ncbi:Bug family tripartite tricarboxylate transporter substrate binding protein [Roseococcus sp. YIM B11640]|uniref:Bug family tripartite tricarboxylate transporter substrate binding protein n=1 Tax=Roseococcus sp. YIM B11640 TaxID=3133973 RepID=UPI003C7E4BC6
MRAFSRRGLFAAAASLAAAPAFGQVGNFPNRSLRLLVPFPPAGAADVMSRVIAEAARPAIGQSVVVENRSGGGGSIGTEAAIRSPADGYTVFMGNQSTHSFNPEMRTLGYDPAVSLVPIAAAGNVAQVIYVRNNLGVTDVAGLIALAKSRPGQISYGTSGVGTGTHLSMLLLESHAGIELNHVPFRGTAPATAALLAGQVDLTIDTMPTALPHIQSGSVRPIAVTTATRHPRLPDVPALTEAGFRDYEAVLYYALFVHADTPAPIVNWLGDKFEQLMAQPAVGTKLLDMGCDPLPVSRADLPAYIARDRARWGAVIRRANIRVE